MPDFSQLFKEANWEPVNYKGNTVVLLDKFFVKDQDLLIITIEKATNTRRQGLCIDITGSCEYNRHIYKQGKGIRMLFWADTAPKHIQLKVLTKKEFVWVENIWEQTNCYSCSSSTGESIKKTSKSVEYGHSGSAMIVEEIENGRRYRCNDGYPDEDFADIVFTVQRMEHKATS